MNIFVKIIISDEIKQSIENHPIAQKILPHLPVDGTVIDVDVEKYLALIGFDAPTALQMLSLLINK